jgi:DNA-binding response OmpR family regulator
MRLLLAEDDSQLRSSLVRGLRDQSYAVDPVIDGDAALLGASITDYDALVLDILLPRQTGVDVCRELRRRGNRVPIILLTALDSVRDRVNGLDAGADDYLTKPFSLDELLARLRALLRRDSAVPAEVITVGDLVVDTRRHQVSRGVRPILLTAKEYALLEMLARNAGRPVTRTELVARVWDDNHDPASNLVNICVSRIRRKIDRDEPVALLSVLRGVGYMLSDPEAVSTTPPR